MSHATPKPKSGKIVSTVDTIRVEKALDGLIVSTLDTIQRGLLTEQEMAFCLRTLEKAQKAGVKLEHLDTAFGHSVAWLLPNGKTVSGSIQRTKECALFNACKALLPHIFEYV